MSICDHDCDWATKHCDENHVSGTAWMLKQIEDIADEFHEGGLVVDEGTVRYVLRRLRGKA